MAWSIYLQDVINIMHLELEEILCDLWMVYAVLQAKKHDLICGITYMHCRKRMKAQRVAV
jgi:hypothetical protein